MKKQKQIKPSRLLDHFIFQKMKNYEEPTRAGTPRGDPIGYSMRKYWAAALCLKTIPLKEMAELVKVSHGLLRKWRTEDSFKKLVDELSTEYVTEVINHIVKRGIKQAELADEYFSRSVKEISKTPPPELTWNEFEDLKFYSEELMGKIMFVSIKHYESLLKEVETHFTLDGPSLQKEELSVYFQVETFWEIIRHYPFRKRDLSKHFDLFDADNVGKNLFYDAILIRIDQEWSEDGELSEETLKRTIYTLHEMAKKFTPVDMDI